MPPNSKSLAEEGAAIVAFDEAGVSALLMAPVCERLRLVCGVGEHLWLVVGVG